MHSLNPHLNENKKPKFPIQGHGISNFFKPVPGNQYSNTNTVGNELSYQFQPNSNQESHYQTKLSSSLYQTKESVTNPYAQVFPQSNQIGKNSQAQQIRGKLIVNTPIMQITSPPKNYQKKLKPSMPMSSLTNPNATFQKSTKNGGVINEQLNEVNSQVKSVEAGNMSESQRAYQQDSGTKSKSFLIKPRQSNKQDFQYQQLPYPTDSLQSSVFIQQTSASGRQLVQTDFDKQKQRILSIQNREHENFHQNSLQNMPTQGYSNMQLRNQRMSNMHSHQPPQTQDVEMVIDQHNNSTHLNESYNFLKESSIDAKASGIEIYHSNKVRSQMDHKNNIEGKEQNQLPRSSERTKNYQSVHKSDLAEYYRKVNHNHRGEGYEKQANAANTINSNVTNSIDDFSRENQSQQLDLLTAQLNVNQRRLQSLKGNHNAYHRQTNYQVFSHLENNSFSNSNAPYSDPKKLSSKQLESGGFQILQDNQDNQLLQKQMTFNSKSEMLKQEMATPVAPYSYRIGNLDQRVSSLPQSNLTNYSASQSLAYQQQSLTQTQSQKYLKQDLSSHQQYQSNQQQLNMMQQMRNSTDQMAHFQLPKIHQSQYQLNGMTQESQNARHRQLAMSIGKPDFQNKSNDSFKIEMTQLSEKTTTFQTPQYKLNQGKSKHLNGTEFGHYYQNIIDENKIGHQKPQKKNLQHVQGLSLTIIRNKQLLKKMESDMHIPPTQGQISSGTGIVQSEQMMNTLDKQQFIKDNFQQPQTKRLIYQQQINFPTDHQSAVKLNPNSTQLQLGNINHYDIPRRTIHNQLSGANNWFLLSLNAQAHQASQVAGKTQQDSFKKRKNPKQMKNPQTYLYPVNPNLVNQEEMLLHPQFRNIGKASNGSFYFTNSNLGNANNNPSLKKDLMGFLEIQKMSMPSKEMSILSQNQMQVQNLQQQYFIEQSQLTGLLESIQSTQMKNKLLQQQNQMLYSQLLQQSPSNHYIYSSTQTNFGAPTVLIQAAAMAGGPTKKLHHFHHMQQRSMQLSSLENESASQVPAVLPMNPNFLKFVVLPGNNSRLIKEAMLRRSHKWIETVAQDPYYHFKWQPVSFGIKFDLVGTYIVQGLHPCQKQLVNHLEFHSNLTEKSKLFKNLTTYSIKLKENVFDYIPLTFFVEINVGNPKYYSKAMLPFMNSFYALEDIKKKTIKYYLKVDDLKGSQSPIKQKQISNNDSLDMVTPGGAEDPYDEQFIFKHFYNNKRGLIKQHIKEEKESKEKTLKKHFFKYTMPFCHFSGHNFWLLKPTKLNRGRGIHVYNNLTVLKQLVFKYCEGFKKSNNQTSSTGATSTAAISQITQSTAANSNSQSNGMKQLPLKFVGGEIAGGQSKFRTTASNNIANETGTEDMTNENFGSLEQQQQLEMSQEMDEEEIEDQIQELDSPQIKDKQVSKESKINGGQEKKGSTVNQATNQFKHNSFILQKYIERPLLIYQRKFDIRVWVMINYDYSCYMFKEGYLRTSSSEYSIDPNNPDDQYVHLTNNAIQKYSENYGNFEDGNQMSYDAFQRYLDRTGVELNVKENLIEKMKQLIVRSIFATKHNLDPKMRKNCFELFGYDFIIDEDLNLWLIEVNTNPCIEESSNILKIYIPRMIDDMLKLSVDQLYSDFNPQQANLKNASDFGTIEEGLEEQKYVFPVDGYEDEENMWEYLFNIKDKQSRKEAKARFFTPISINSKYAFQIKDRQFKVKKYFQESNQATGAQNANAFDAQTNVNDVEGS